MIPKKSFKINGLDKDETYLHLILTSACNYRCPYCVASEVDPYKGVLNSDCGKRELSKDDIDYIFDNIKIDNVRVLIVGGEPLLSRNLNYLIDMLENNDHVNYIELLTNGSIPLNKVHLNEKLIMIFTYHPYKTNQKNIVKNLVYCTKNNIPLEFNVMLPQDRSYPNIEKILTVLKALNIPPLPIYPSIEFQEFNFTQKKYPFEDFRVFKIDDSDELLSFRDVCSQRLNRFKGWKCDNKLFIVDINKKVRQCTGEILGDIKGFDFTNTERICNLDSCVHEGFLRALKTRI